MTDFRPPLLDYTDPRYDPAQDDELPGQLPEDHAEPGDHVLIDGRTRGVVTYPGLNGIPGRVYVRHDGITTHHAPNELTFTTPEGTR